MSLKRFVLNDMTGLPNRPCCSATVNLAAVQLDMRTSKVFARQFGQHLNNKNGRTARGTPKPALQNQGRCVSPQPATTQTPMTEGNYQVWRLVLSGEKDHTSTGVRSPCARYTTLQRLATVRDNVHASSKTAKTGSSAQCPADNRQVRATP